MWFRPASDKHVKPLCDAFAANLKKLLISWRVGQLRIEGDLLDVRQYVQRWVSWLRSGLQGAVTENRFNQIWNYVNKKLSG